MGNLLSELDGRTACYRISGVAKDCYSIKSATVTLMPGNRHSYVGFRVALGR